VYEGIPTIENTTWIPKTDTFWKNFKVLSYEWYFPKSTKKTTRAWQTLSHSSNS
jgi:hypothetical protein